MLYKKNLHINTNSNITKMDTTFYDLMELTIWTIRAFRVMNPGQWSFAKFTVTEPWNK